MRYLVAIDGGVVSEAAFKAACAALGEKDELIVVTIVPDMVKKYAITGLEPSPALATVSVEAQDGINERGKKLLNTYLQRAKDLGAKQVKAVLVSDNCAKRFTCQKYLFY